MAICQCVDIGQTKQRSAERVRFFRRGNQQQQKSKGERVSAPHLSRIDHSSEIVFDLFLLKKKKEFCLEGTAPVRPHVSSPFIFFKKTRRGVQENKDMEHGFA